MKRDSNLSIKLNLKAASLNKAPVELPKGDLLWGRIIAALLLLIALLVCLVWGLMRLLGQDDAPTQMDIDAVNQTAVSQVHAEKALDEGVTERAVLGVAATREVTDGGAPAKGAADAEVIPRVATVKEGNAVEGTSAVVDSKPIIKSVSTAESNATPAVVTPVITVSGPGPETATVNNEGHLDKEVETLAANSGLDQEKIPSATVNKGALVVEQKPAADKALVGVQSVVKRTGDTLKAIGPDVPGTAQRPSKVVEKTVIVPAAFIANTPSVDQTTSVEPVSPRAVIDIKSDDVRDAQLSLAMHKLRPIGKLPQLISLGDEPLLTVYFFLSYQNLKGQSVYHDWYLGNKRMARVQSRLSPQTEDTHSTKFIDQYMLGDWHVQAVTESGEVLASGKFTVVR